MDNQKNEDGIVEVNFAHFYPSVYKAHGVDPETPSEKAWSEFNIQTDELRLKKDQVSQEELDQHDQRTAGVYLSMKRLNDLASRRQFVEQMEKQRGDEPIITRDWLWQAKLQYELLKELEHPDGPKAEECDRDLTRFLHAEAHPSVQKFTPDDKSSVDQAINYQYSPEEIEARIQALIKDGVDENKEELVMLGIIFSEGIVNLKSSLEDEDDDLYEQVKTKLIALSYITEQDIWAIYKVGDEAEPDYKTMVYDFNTPLSHKMIWRWRNAPCAAYFWNSVTVANREMLLAKFDIYRYELIGIGIYSMDFFIWLVNSRVPWKNFQMTEDPIRFFFRHTRSEQRAFIAEYNKLN